MMNRSNDGTVRTTLLIVIALCGIASASKSETAAQATPRYLDPSVLLAGLVTDPPPPPDLIGAGEGSEREEGAGNRPVYKKAWFLVAAASVAVLATGLIVQRDRSSGGRDTHTHIGFPPPPGGTLLGIHRREWRVR